MPVIFYDSVGEFLNSLPHKPKHGEARGEYWDGNQTYSEARANLLAGRPDRFRASDRLLEEIDEAGIEIEVPMLDIGRTGFLPCVPAYIAGSPDSMFCIQDTPMDSTPIRLFLGITYSRGVPYETIHKRGIAMLALARKLAQIRPVEMYCFFDGEGRDTHDGTGKCAIPVVRIDTQPLDTATASYALTDAGFSRQLCFEWGYPRGFGGQWAWCGDPTDESYRKRLREVLKAGVDDLVMPGGYLTDELLEKPVEWVNNEISKFLLHNATKQDS